MREHPYREEYNSCIKNKGLEWDEESSVENMQEQVKRVMVDIGREVYGSVKVWGMNPDCVVEWLGCLEGGIRRLR